LQGRYDEIRKQGLGLVAISYDSPDTLKTFAASRGITFPLLSDPGSAIIKRYGLLNDQVDPQTRTYGIPHPGTFIVDRKGTVKARFFEDAYQERYTAAAILAAQGGRPAGTPFTARTNHLSMRASITDASVAPGERISVVADVTPDPTMHVYAPGKHTYQVVRLVIDQQPWLRVHEIRYPPSEIYDFKPLNERVNVYARPFRLVRDVTILATPDAQELLESMPKATITGALEYQACDDRLCFNPVRVPLTFTMTMRQLERRSPER
jgi:hypothetical protein